MSPTDIPVRALAAALDAKDAQTRSHSDRVVRLALALGRECALAPADLQTLSRGAVLHDLGKIGIPDRVLNYPGPLSPADWAVMQTHPVLGEAILRAAGMDDLDDVCGVVRHHHENFDGSGYPDGLAGEAIPALARMVHLADAYDAMVSDRAYRAGMAHAKAMAILDGEAGGRGDPWIFGRFVRALAKDPSLLSA